MAVGFAVTSKGLQYNGRITLLVILSCMMAAIGGLIFGYDIGISGGVTSMEPFLRKFFSKVYTRIKEDTKISNYCKYDSQLLTSFTSSLYIAELVASLFASLITQPFGRKPSILAGGAVFLAGSALGEAAVHVYMLILGQLLLEIGVGFANQIDLRKKLMAVGFAVTSKGSQYNGRITLFVILSCMIAAMGGLIFGYDTGVSGGVTSMEPFLRKFFPKVYTSSKEDNATSNYCKFDSQLLTSFTSSLYIAGLVASFFASSVTKTFGRKPSILAGGAVFLAGAAIGGAAVNVYMLILGRLLLGIGVGFTNQSIPLYLSEMAPPQYRGAFNIGFQLCVGIGYLAATLINYGTEKIKSDLGWRISLGMAAVPASILTLGAFFLPDTANSLIQRNNDCQKAKAMLQRVRGTTDVQAELDDLIQASEMSKTTEDYQFRLIVQPKYRPQLVMAIAIPFFQQVTGINVIAFYAPQLFRTMGFKESASLISSVVTGVVGLCTTCLSMFIVDKVGRRFLFLFGGILMLILQLVIGSIMAAQLGDQGGLSEGYATALLLLLCVYVAGFGLSWGPLGWLVPSEIFQLEIRSAGQSIAVAVNFLFTFIIAQTFLSMLCHFKSGTFFFFGGWVAVMTAFVYFLLPETKNMPIELMNRVWEEHWFWKRIVKQEKGENKMEQEIETQNLETKLELPLK